jgi:hypothetical protein
MEEGIEKTRKQKLEIGNWQSYSLVSNFQFHFITSRPETMHFKQGAG